MKELRVARLLSMLMIMAVLVSAGTVSCGPTVAPPPEPPPGGVPEGEQPPAGQPPGEQPPAGPPGGEQPASGQPPGEQPPGGPAPGGELPGGPGPQPAPPGAGPQPTPPGPGPAPGTASGDECPGAPTFSYFTASPSSISSGQQVELSWGPVTSGASGPLVGSVVLSPGGFGEVGSPGSRWASPTTTTTYRLTATGCGGTATKDVTVTVGGAAAAATATPHPGGPMATNTPTSSPPGMVMTAIPIVFVRLTLVNLSTRTFCYVYMRMQGETSSGSNWLASGETVAPGKERTWQILPGMYDVRIEECSTKSHFEGTIEISSEFDDVTVEIGDW